MRPAPTRVVALAVLLSSVLLAGCLAPALLLPSPTSLMLSLLQPLVGLDPKVAHLYEQPLVKSRMTALLGPHYDTAVTVLETADRLEREGPLFYVVSKFSPVPEIAEKAGLVWNAETNQMAVAIASGDGVQVFSEAVARKIEERAATIVDATVDQTVDAAADTTLATAAGPEAVAAARALAPRWPRAMQEWASK